MAGSAISTRYVGRFRTRVVRDIICSVSLGVGIAYSWWFLVSRPHIARVKEYHSQVRKETIAEAEAWLKETKGSVAE